MSFYWFKRVFVPLWPHNRIALLVLNFYFHRPSIEQASADKLAYPLPDKPSIALLPFTNVNGDLEQDNIGDGLSENIISAPSVSSKIFIIARNSTFTYKGKPVKVQKAAEDLGVQYVLEGSIQKSGDRLRVTSQLIDALILIVGLNRGFCHDLSIA